MTDVVDKRTRSRMMSGIKGKNTKPELFIRSALHRRGFRFRTHYDKLPGKPDIALPKYRALILVNGCFWHGHGCHLFKWPKANRAFWKTKIEANMKRDIERQDEFFTSGWRTLIFWECAFKGKSRLTSQELEETIHQWIISDSIKMEISGKD